MKTGVLYIADYSKLLTCFFSPFQCFSCRQRHPVGQHGIRRESLEMFCCQILAENAKYDSTFFPTVNCTHFYATVHGNVKQSAHDVM